MIRLPDRAVPGLTALFFRHGGHCRSLVWEAVLLLKQGYDLKVITFEMNFENFFSKVPGFRLQPGLFQHQWLFVPAGSRLSGHRSSGYQLIWDFPAWNYAQRPGPPDQWCLAAVINKTRKYFDVILAHTGQNYDYNLNGVFFRDLQLANPEVYKNFRRTIRWQLYIDRENSGLRCHWYVNCVWNEENLRAFECGVGQVVIGAT